MKAISLLFILTACTSLEDFHVESGPGLVLPGVMHCLRDKYGWYREGVFRYSYVAWMKGHPEQIKILKTPFDNKSINACIKLSIRGERIPTFPKPRTLVQELRFER